ncbi:MAG: isochorismate synthase [Myxococcaceae bacterium]
MSSRARPQPLYWAAARQVASVDPLECGRQGSVLWDRPEAGESFAGLGEAATLSGKPSEVLQRIQAAPVRWLSEVPGVPGPWFGGIAFDPERAPTQTWSGFGAARFILPELAVARSSGRSWALAFVEAATEEEARPALSARLDEAESILDEGRTRSALPRVPVQRLGPETGEVAPQWRSLVEAALNAVDSGRLEKVVGAREIRRELPEGVTPREIARRLRVRHPACTTFLFTGADGACFLGATPETLLRVEDGFLKTEALAGTLAPGQQAPSAKEVREHDVVVEGIRAALEVGSQWVEAEATPSLHSFGPLVHLRTQIVARLISGTTLATLVGALHPTPAVGGLPRKEALDFLRLHEGFDRGWYAGAVGWVDSRRAHLCVGLRSALVRGRELRVFAGAGLVAGSDPDAEWIETARKAEAVLSVFGGPT